MTHPLDDLIAKAAKKIPLNRSLPPRHNMPPKICGNCRTPLNVCVDLDTGDTEYRHGGASHCDDLDPIAHDGGNIVERCDFCLSLDPTWSFPCKRMEDPNVAFFVREDGDVEPADRNRHISSDEWACCEGCMPLVDASDWRALWKRNPTIVDYKTEAPENYHTARLAVLNLWTEFAINRTGPPYRLKVNHVR